MKNTLAMIAVIVIGFIAAGWYLDWFSIKKNPNGNGTSFTIEVNTPKLKSDLTQGREKLQGVLKTSGNSKTESVIEGFLFGSDNSNSQSSTNPNQKSPGLFEDGFFVLPGKN